ncbi:MAG: MerC domain-containing protein [Litorimonas sp.]
MTVKTIDYSGVALSSLCIVHCVLLPVAASMLPIAASIAENEFFHKALVLLAIGPAALAFFRRSSSKFAPAFRSLGVMGIVTLLASAFVEAFHDIEASLTLFGAFSLASAHIWRIGSTRHHPLQN